MQSHILQGLKPKSLLGRVFGTTEAVPFQSLIFWPRFRHPSTALRAGSEVVPFQNPIYETSSRAYR
jgi:hypothetical protein